MCGKVLFTSLSLSECSLNESESSFRGECMTGQVQVERDGKRMRGRKYIRPTEWIVKVN